MIKFPSYNIDGKKNKEISIDIKSRKSEVNLDLVYQVINSYLSNKRYNIANTKTRAEVSGTGKKPYKQKGTGNARFGSLRTPIHIGGGIAMGPRNNRNFTKKINKKMRQKAIKLILLEKNLNNELLNIEDFELNKISSKLALQKIVKIPFNKKGSILLITDKKNNNIYLSFRNIPEINTIIAKDVNALELAKYRNIVFINNSYTAIEKLLK